jgi:hypothetical protein
MIIMHTEHLIRLTHMYVCVHIYIYIPHCYNYYRPYYDSTYDLTY